MRRAILTYLLAVACGGQTLPPAGQLVVHVGTDAPLPSAPGLPAPSIPPLFDRIRISVYEPSATSACAGCTGEFAIDSTLEAAGKISFGAVLPAGATGYVARIDMFRGVATVLGDPIPRATITQYVALPAVGTEGIITVGAFLSVDDVGNPRGSLQSPVDVIPGEPPYDKVGTWPGATRLPCTGTPNFGEACVPGGAYWMGNPRVSVSLAAEEDNVPHLVVVSPFFYDTTEVTVSSFRSSQLAALDPLAAGNYGATSVDPIDGSSYQAQNQDPLQGFCNYTTFPGNNEALPLNCVSWAKAAQYCLSLGKTLASEAQYEYAASGLVSSLYVWGNDTPGCSDAIWGRAGFFNNAHVAQFSNACNGSGRTFGALAPGSGSIDRLTLAGASIVDLQGNMSEWTADLWNGSSEPCWTSPILTNPVCQTASPTLDGGTSDRAVRGGSWLSSIGETQSAQRSHLPPGPPGTVYVGTGFRCVRPGK